MIKKTGYSDLRKCLRFELIPNILSRIKILYVQEKK